MALQSDGKEMGRVKLHMLIDDSDSQCSTHMKRLPCAREWAGANQKKQVCAWYDKLDWKNQEMNCEINDKLRALNKEKYIQYLFYVWFNVIYVKGQNVAETSQTNEDK